MHSNARKWAGLLLPLVFLAFAPPGDNRPGLENYNDLLKMKDAGMPRNIRMLKIQNFSFQKPVITEGVLITYKNRSAERVKISGTFSHWRTIPMERGKYGVWFYLLTDGNSRNSVKYKFLVDGIWTSDPRNPRRVYDGNGSYLSAVDPPEHQEGKQVSYRLVARNLVEFRIFKPRARLISVVGDFNNWNPENDILERTDGGIWRIRKRLSDGIYRYKFIVDGKWVPDYFNSNSASDEVGGICSVIRVR